MSKVIKVWAVIIMSKLEELIKELCHNGVKFIALEEVCDFNRGTPITSKDA